LFIFSCKLNYGDALGDDFEAGIPDVRSLNSRYEVYQDGALVLLMEAEQLDLFNALGLRILNKVNFRQYDSDGALLAQGYAGSARYDIQNETCEFRDGLIIELKQEETRLETDYMLWDKKNDSLSGKPDVYVLGTKADGSKFEGYDFFMNLRRRDMQLSGTVSGVLEGE